MIGVRVVKFERPRPLTEYVDDHGNVLPGFEVGEPRLILPYAAMDAMAKAIATRQPCELVVTGEEFHPDGRHYLMFGVPTDYIEATTDYRHESGGLHYVCPDCGQKRGQHMRGCPGRLP